MQALLVLYMVDQLLRPGHVEHVAGFGAFRSGVEAVFGPLSTQALASQIFGLYTAFVYSTPILGGLIGDRWLGQRRAVMLGAVLMAAGHFLMALEASFLIALALLILGGGFIKGNIAAQVGNLYARDDGRRTRAFSVFFIGINVGALIAPLVCGTLGELYGWHYGFGAAGFGMLIAMAIYTAGRRHLPPDAKKTKTSAKVAKAKLGADGWRTVGALLVIVLINIIFVSAYNQSYNMFPLWAREFTNRHMLGLEMPVTWFFTIESLCTIGFTAFTMRLWSRQAACGTEPGDMVKIGVGCVLGIIAFLVLAFAAATAGRVGQVSMVWGMLYFAILDLGLVVLWPVSLALVSRTAPAQINSLMIGVFYLAPFFANNMVGWIGRFYETMAPAQFWLMHAGIIATALALVLLSARPLTRVLAPGEGEGHA